MQQFENNEKRSSPRLKVPVYIQTFEKAFPIGMLINVSTRGLFVQSTDPKEVGTLLDLRFQLPDSEQWVRLKAEVVWANRPPSFAKDEPFVPSRRSVNDNPGMGLNILSIAPECKAPLEQFLQDRRVDE